MKIDKTWGEWYWLDDDGVVASPRFITKQEACYWLVQFECDRSEPMKVDTET